jgi:hypothetical protein
LVRWLDAALPRQADWRGGVLGAILGMGWGFAGALCGILLGGFQLPVSYLSIPLAVGFAATIGGLTWYFRGRTSEDAERARLWAQTRTVIYRMYAARHHGRLKDLFGEHGLALLEEAAKEWHRCRGALDSEVWKSMGNAPAYRKARESAMRSMDAAMARLVIMVGNCGDTAKELEECTRIVAEMRQMADEALQLMNSRAREPIGGSQATEGLRDALSQLKMLSEAEKELDEARRLV